MTSSPAAASPVYDTIGLGYVAHRKVEPRWEALIHEQLGDGRVVVNVGAGTGNYEPLDRDVVAVDPSAVMVGQRAVGAAPAVRASGSALPFVSNSADVALAILTLHHWDDWAGGLAELCRVAPRRVVLTMDFDLHSRFWFLEDYVPEVGEATRALEPGYAAVAEAIGTGAAGGAGDGVGNGVDGGHVDVIPLLVPRDMHDGVLGAYWCRPEAYLDPAVRANCSGLALADPAVVARGVAALETDLHSGAWQRRHADLAELDAIDLGYRLVVADIG
jgi:SAM-dependent methyltransferase